MYYSRDSGLHIVHTLGPEVCKCYLHCAIWNPRVKCNYIFAAAAAAYTWVGGPSIELSITFLIKSHPS